MATSEVKLKSAKEFRAMDQSSLREAEREIRKSLADMRMELLADQKINTGKKRALHANLARLLTVKGELKVGAKQVVSSKPAKAKSTTKKPTAAARVSARKTKG